MKVVAFNGSPKKDGNTYQAINIVTGELKKEGIETEIVHVGDKAIRGCTACQGCKVKNEKCVITTDEVNDWIQKMKNADGIILGSPVYYSGVNGTMKSFLDRAFYVIGANGNFMKRKVGISLAAVRRSGGIPAIEQLNKYINFSEMLMPGSCYWNVIHGRRPGDIVEDKEGLQIMEVLGQNMAWTMKLIENGKGIVKEPNTFEKVMTSFVR